MNQCGGRPGLSEAPAGFVSIVIPAHNEELNVPHLYSRVVTALDGSSPFEIIFVDDGSSDGTAERVRELRSQDKRVRLVRFGRNFGHQAALAAGLESARGDAVLTLDCDLQHPPELLPQMISAWRSGARVVQMVRLQTVGANWFNQLASRFFYVLVNYLSETRVVPGAADYQLLDREVVAAVLRFRDRQPFLRGLVGWLGFPSMQLSYVAPARAAGRSSYSLRKMIRLSLNAVTSLSSKPLRLSFYLGLITAAFSLVYGAFALWALAAGRTVPGWTSVIVTVTFLGAVQLVSVGIAGEYIARIYDQTRGVPRFVIVEADHSVYDSVPAKTAAF